MAPALRREVDEIVLLFLDPKHVLYFAGGIRLSPELRKRYALYSYTCNSHGAELGLKPTVREVRCEVERKGGPWPWVEKSPDADVQVLRTARKALKANKIDDNVL